MSGVRIRPWAALLGSALIVSTFAGPAHADTWKSERGNGGERLRWYSCTVTYAIDYNGHATASRKPLLAAMGDVERATGINFRQVPWQKARLKVNLLHVSNGNYYAKTAWHHIGSTTTSADMRVYKMTFNRSAKLQANLYRHEIGHALGLAHVSGSDVMNRVITADRTQTSWRRGLTWLYRKSCS